MIFRSLTFISILSIVSCGTKKEPTEKPESAQIKVDSAITESQQIVAEQLAIDSSQYLIYSTWIQVYEKLSLQQDTLPTISIDIKGSQFTRNHKWYLHPSSLKVMGAKCEGWEETHREVIQFFNDSWGKPLAISNGPIESDRDVEIKLSTDGHYYSFIWNASQNPPYDNMGEISEKRFYENISSYSYPIKEHLEIAEKHANGEDINFDTTDLETNEEELVTFKCSIDSTLIEKVRSGEVSGNNQENEAIRNADN